MLLGLLRAMVRAIFRKRVRIPRQLAAGYDRRVRADLPLRDHAVFTDPLVAPARVHAIRGALGWPSPSKEWPFGAAYRSSDAPEVQTLADGSQPVAMPIAGDGIPRS